MDDESAHCGAPADELRLLRERVADLEAQAATAREAERRVRESCERYRLLLESAGDAIIITDAASGEVIDCNRRAETFLGRTRDQVIGARHADFFPAEAAGELAEAIRNADSQRPVTVDAMMRGADGATRDMQITVTRHVHGEQHLVQGIYRDVTDHKRREAALKKSEERLSLVVRAANLGLWDWDLQTNDVVFGEQWMWMLGYEPGELECTVQTWERLVHPDDLERVKELLHAHFRCDLPGYEAEFRMRAKSGDWVWILSRGVVVERDEEGRPLRVTGIHLDITDRKRMEEALQRRVVALTQPLDDASNVEFEDLFNLDELQAIQNAFAASTGVASLITSPDGTPITQPSNFCRLCSTIIRGTEKGRCNCARSDTIIGQEKADGPTVQPCLSGGLWDAGASIRVGGRHVANWLIGQVKNDAQDEEHMLTYADEIGANREAFREALAEVPVMSEAQFRTVAEALYLFAKGLSEKAYQNAQQARFIADLKRANEERDRLEGQLRQSQKMEAIGQLAGGVAHDFNNILTAILGNTELAATELMTHSPTLAGPLEHLKQIEKSAQRASALTRQLLAFSRRQIVRPEVLDLNVVLRDLEKMLRRLITENIELKLALAPQLSAVRVDPGQFEQVVVNLVVNARDAMPEGGRLILETSNTVLDDTYVASHPEALAGDYALLVVSDTGHGMDRATSDRIFEPFFTTKPMGQGTGLGLATVYGIIKQAGGHVAAYSEVGKGTAFRVYLPSVRGVTTSAPAATQQKTPAARGETVLTCEDDASVRELTARVLEDAGYTVLAASNARDAMKMAADYHSAIDLLITDVIMPDRDGKTLADDVTALRSNVRVLFVSGYTADVIGHHGVLREGVAFLEKPYSRRQLLERVRDVLDRQPTAATS